MSDGIRADGFVVARLSDKNGVNKSEVINGYNVITNIGKKAYFNTFGSSMYLTYSPSCSIGRGSVIQGGFSFSDSSKYVQTRYMPCLLLLNLTEEQKMQLNVNTTMPRFMYNADFTGYNQDIIIGIGTPYYAEGTNNKMGTPESDHMGSEHSATTSSSIMKYIFPAGVATGTFNTVMIAYFDVNSQYLTNGVSATKSLNISGGYNYRGSNCFAIQPDVTGCTSKSEIILCDASSDSRTPYKKYNFVTGELSNIDSSLSSIKMPSGSAPQLRVTKEDGTFDRLYYFLDSATSGGNVPVYYADLLTGTWGTSTYVYSYNSTLFFKDGYLYTKASQEGTFYAYDPFTFSNDSSKNFSISESDIPKFWDTSSSYTMEYSRIQNTANTVVQSSSGVWTQPNYLINRCDIDNPYQSIYSFSGVVVSSLTDIKNNIVNILPALTSHTNYCTYTKNDTEYMLLLQSNIRDYARGDEVNVEINQNSFPTYTTNGLFYSDCAGSVLQYKIEDSDITKSDEQVLEVIYGVRTDA